MKAVHQGIVPAAPNNRNGSISLIERLAERTSGNPVQKIWERAVPLGPIVDGRARVIERRFSGKRPEILNGFFVSVRRLQLETANRS
jgi:hypothetical protein